MSKMKIVLEVTNPSVRTAIEHLRTVVVDCGYCGGSGFFVADEVVDGTSRKVCPLCGGSGRLSADVTVSYSRVND